MTAKYRINIFDQMGEIVDRIDMSPIEGQAVGRRLNGLATASVPPNWGYAGMLLDFVESGDIKDVFDVYATIDEWRKQPDLAERLFRAWNNARLRES